MTIANSNALNSLDTLRALQEAEFPSLQALTVAALSQLPCAAYVLLRVDDLEAEAKTRLAHDWLAQLADRLTVVVPKTAGRTRKREPALNLALTRAGLRAMGLTEAEMETFSFPFWQGMTAAHRTAILGDRGSSDPQQWAWGKSDTPDIHLLLLLFAPDPPAMDVLLQQEKAAWTQANLVPCAPVLHAGQRKTTREHFGFLDGVGQPVVNGTPNRDNQKERTGHETVINAGEFVLGYTNEDEIPAPSPTVSAARDSHNWLRPARTQRSGTWEDDPTLRDLGFNGSYLVFRHLQQHVAHFWNALLTAADEDTAQSEWLAAKVIGRWPSGAPFTLYPQATSDPFPDGYPAQPNGRAQVENDFKYRARDAAGVGCPLGAHIRRANPRDTLGSNGDVALQSARRHRLLRRGRVYGPDVEDRLIEDDKDRGLFFLCLCSDIERQFEFVQQTWINNPNFAGLNGESDPLLGQSSAGADALTIPRCPVRQRIAGLSDFVTVRGGAYFFLPSLPTIRFLASL